MLIGQLADALGIPTATVRLYERKGLLPDPRRAENGYCVYDDTTLARLRFIRTAQSAGLKLAEISSVEPCEPGPEGQRAGEQLADGVARADAMR